MPGLSYRMARRLGALGVRVMEDADRILAATPLDAFERAIDDPLGDRFLALIHQAVHKLGQDDVADVANLIGYSYRKLGDYKVSQVWYERALQADPNHVRTWQCYGLWQLEQGNRESAQYHLGRIKQICGTDCAEYKSLAMALELPAGTGLVY